MINMDDKNFEHIKEQIKSYLTPMDTK